jgi:hypothetical protein
MGGESFSESYKERLNEELEDLYRQFRMSMNVLGPS